MIEGFAAETRLSRQAGVVVQGSEEKSRILLLVSKSGI